MSSTPNGDGRLRVDVQATTSPGSQPNLIQWLDFTRLDNAAVRIGNQDGVIGRHNLTPPAQSLTLYVSRGPTPNAASTVELTVRDACGDWRSFVGGGPNAF